MPEAIRIGGLELRFLRDKHDTQGALDMFEMTVPPGGAMPVAHYHKDWDETAYGIEGEVTFTVAGVAQPLKPGEALYIPKGTVHGFDNTSGKPARCLCVLTPGVLGPEYFEELGSYIATLKGPPDEAKVEAIMLKHGLVPAG